VESAHRRLRKIPRRRRCGRVPEMVRHRRRARQGDRQRIAIGRKPGMQSGSPGRAPSENDAPMPRDAERQRSDFLPVPRRRRRTASRIGWTSGLYSWCAAWLGGVPIADDCKRLRSTTYIPTQQVVSEATAMLAISAENLTRLRKGITAAIGRRQNRRAIYQFLEAELRALHYSYGIGSELSYIKAITFLEHCREFTLRNLVAEQVIKIFMDAVHMLVEGEA
jgi:hypothetical protein